MGINVFQINIEGEGKENFASVSTIMTAEIVFLAAVFSIVTHRSSPGGALRDDTKNGCEGDYRRECRISKLESRRD